MMLSCWSPTASHRHQAFTKDPRQKLTRSMVDKLCKSDKAFLLDVLKSHEMCVVSDPNQHDQPIVYASPQFCEFAQYDVEEVVGRNCRFLQGPFRESQTKELDRVRTALALQSKNPLALVLRNVKKDGTPFLNHLLLVALFDVQGNLALFVGLQELTELENVNEDSHPMLLRYDSIHSEGGSATSPKMTRSPSGALNQKTVTRVYKRLGAQAVCQRSDLLASNRSNDEQQVAGKTRRRSRLLTVVDKHISSTSS